MRQCCSANSPPGGRRSCTERARWATDLSGAKVLTNSFSQRRSGPDLAGAIALPLVGRQFFEPHRAACANLVSADSDLGAHAELAAVREAGRGLPINPPRIDIVQELSSPG